MRVLTVRFCILALILAAEVPKKKSWDLTVTDGVANFIAEVMVRVFNATRVEILVASNSGSMTTLVSLKMHLLSIATTVIRITSRDTGLIFMNSLFNGLPTNTKFYVICLLSPQEYLEHIAPVDYGLLGPMNAKRSNCSGSLMIARLPKPRGNDLLLQAQPAKEERSNTLTVVCGRVGIDDEKEPHCWHPEIEEALHMMENYLNITHLLKVIAPLPIVPDDVFPQQGTFSGMLTHGVADMRFAYVSMTDRRAFSTQFTFPFGFYKLGYLFPSPRFLKSGFTVLKIFSFTAWCCWGVSIALVVFTLRVVTYMEQQLPRVKCLAGMPSSHENIVPPLATDKKLSVRSLQLVRYLIIFIMSHCFTGGYISFLNKPILEDAPDTKEKLLQFLRNGRLEPCIGKDMFEHALMMHSKSPLVSQLRNTVPSWSPFAASSIAACVNRTRERRAVTFHAVTTLENYVLLFPGQVELSHVYAKDVIFPASHLLPKASPYKDLLDRATLGMVEAGLIDQFRRHYWHRTLPPPSVIAPEDIWKPLQLNDFILPFIILAAGLGASLAAYVSEVLRGNLKRQ